MEWIYYLGHNNNIVVFEALLIVAMLDKPITNSNGNLRKGTSYSRVRVEGRYVHNKCDSLFKIYALSNETAVALISARYRPNVPGGLE
jgi:hypothetical protein